MPTNRTQREHIGEGPADATMVLRRRLLRNTALAVGAAAGAATVITPAGTAQAADNDPMALGVANDAESTTTLRLGGANGAADPALSLINADGPSLRLDPLPPGWTGNLAVGDMAGTALGPIIGIDLPGGVETTYMVTAADLANVATPFVSNPSRRLDLRTTAGRSSIIRHSSANALSSTGKLRAGEWIDIGIVEAGFDYELQGVFANVTVTGPAAPGFVSAYPPGARPNTSTVNFVANQTVANFAVLGVGLVQGWHTLRIFTKADTWILLDITGGINTGNAQAPLSRVLAQRLKGGRRALADKLRAALARAAR